MTDQTGRTSKIEASLDVFADNALMGWARYVEQPNEPVALQLFLGPRPISIHRADRYRPDLEAAGIGSGRCGFLIPVPPALATMAWQTGESISVRALQDPDIQLFSVDLNELLETPPSLEGFLAERLDAARLSLGSGEAAPPPAGGREVSTPPSYRPLLVGAHEPAARPLSRPLLFPYGEHVLKQNQLENRFAPGQIESDLDHFLRWYIDTYNVSRAPRRAPFSKAAIAWLNELVVLGGSPFALTRVMLWYLSESPQGLSGLADPQGYRKLLYWWACERAPTLNVEDCLVSRRHIAELRQVSDAWAGRFLPLSRFMEEALASRPTLADFASMQAVSARVTAYMIVLVEALDAPGLLRFIPQAVLDRFFGGTDPLFDTLSAAVCGTVEGMRRLDVAGYRNHLRGQGFDLDALAFTSIDPEGHRIEAARLGEVAPVRPVDVQLIGPLNKVSGIAHATRLSRDILVRTGLTLAELDFSLDNPQPELGSSSACIPSGVAARINLIHLNAEMLPLAFAYLPDVHAGAYTIGFFFWELDHPAECHRLALELVDEVWVGSEYNRRCFAAVTDKPVVNVGMALNLDRAPSPTEARREVESRCGARADDFVFLTTFDALSYVSRKNPLGVLRAFQEAFPEDARVRLIIKTHNASAMAEGLGRRVWDEVLRAASEDARVVAIDETLPYGTVMALKAGSNCYVSLHRSEGFGFGMVEAMRLRVPVVCTAYSGNLDFCDDSTAWLVEATEVGVRPDEYAHVSPGHRWGEPNHAAAVAVLRQVRDDAALRERRVHAAAARVAESCSVEAAARRYAQRLGAILADRPVSAEASPQPEPQDLEQDAVSLAPPQQIAPEGSRRLVSRILGRS